MSSRSRAVAEIVAVILVLAGMGGFSSLKGSREKMARQNAVAREDKLVFAATPEQIAQLALARELVPLPGSPDYTTKGVSFAFARPEVLTFVQNLAREYRVVCAGQPLVITSLVRPFSMQPRNASPLSVHPAGIAVDLHIPDPPACRAWLAQRLLGLAGENVLDVTEERHPHHLHVAIFPRAYLAWLARQPKPAAPAPATPGARPTGRAGNPAEAATSLLGRRKALFATALAVLGLTAVGLPLRRRAVRRARRRTAGELSAAEAMAVDDPVTPPDGPMEDAGRAA